MNRTLNRPARARLPSLAAVLLVLGGGVARADVVAEVRAAIAAERWDAARQRLTAERSAHGDTPAALEALSWLARGELAAARLDEALGDARATYAAATAALAGRALDAEPRLPIALGAAIEVEAQARARRGERAAAVAFVERELGRFGRTSIAMRLQKNLNLLTLTGAPAPALEREPHLGAAAPSLATLKGQPVLLFFWAWWCPDCKATAPAVARLGAELAARGLRVIAPTQPYDATFADVEAVWHKAYAALGDTPAPVSAANFDRYGASSMPTLVVLDRAGKVALYHPGKMTYDELKPYLEAAARPASGN